MNRAVEIGLNHAIDDVVVEVVEWHEWLNDTRVVDDRIDGTMVADHNAGKLLDGVAIGNVRGVHRKLRACIGKLRGFVQPLFAYIDGRDFSAAPEQLEHELSPDSAPTTRHDDNLVLHLHLHLRLWPFWPQLN